MGFQAREAMLKRPLNSRFTAAVRIGRKITTIRDKPWRTDLSVMLYNWSGAAYRSKQIDVAAVQVLGVRPGQSVTKCLMRFELLPIYP